MDPLAELNFALGILDFADPAPAEIRFFYNPDNKLGVGINCVDMDLPWVCITSEEYEKIDAAFKFYVNKQGLVKPVPLQRGVECLLEKANDGPFRTIKDCIIFADPDGADAYHRREFNYD